jgi:hypothetical protein
VNWWVYFSDQPYAIYKLAQNVYMLLQQSSVDFEFPSEVEVHGLDPIKLFLSASRYAREE